MRSILATAALVLLIGARPATGAGFAHNENFIVFTPAQNTEEAGQKFAELVLERANEFRAQVAQEWLGEELSAGAGRTTIYVRFSDTDNCGLTWAKDDPARNLHAMSLTTSADKAAGSTLHHEVAHVVLATRYAHPDRLPPWLEEGIASRYDDEASLAARERIVRSWARSGNMPRLAGLLEMTRMPSADDDAYAASTSLVSFLLTRGDRQTLLRFGDSGKQSGWAAALRTHYDIDDVGVLQAEWQAWLKSSEQTASQARPRANAGG